MHARPGIRWKIYFFLFLPIPVAGLIGIVSPQTPTYMYYHILMNMSAEHISAGYIFSYALSVICAVINILSLIPLFLFVFEINLLPSTIWQWLFFARAIFDIAGHSYEIKFIKSGFYADPFSASFSVAISAIILLPSYFACYQYAFLRNKIK